MSVVSVLELHENRDVDFTFLNQSRYTRTFIVIVDSLTDDANTISLHEDIPELGTRWENIDGTVFDENSTLDNIKISYAEDFKWTVQCNYLPINTDDLDNDIEIGTQQFVYPARNAYDPEDPEDVPTQPIVNAVMDPIAEPPLMHNDYDSMITITRYETYTSIDAIMQHLDTYNNTVNDVAFHGRAVKTCLLHITGRRVRVGTVLKMQWRYQIIYRKKTWTEEVINRGFRYKNTVDGPIVYYRRQFDGGGPPQQILLAANGTKLADGNEPIYLPFLLYRRCDWTALNL